MTGHICWLGLKYVISQMTFCGLYVVSMWFVCGNFDVFPYMLWIYMHVSVRDFDIGMMLTKDCRQGKVY